MSLVRTPAILLRKRDYSETSLITVFYTQDYGKVQFFIKGAKRPKGSFLGSFEHFSCYEIVYQHRTGQHGLTLLREAHLMDAFPEIRKDLSLFYHASYCIELLDSFTETEEPHSNIYHLLYKTLKDLGEKTDVDLVLRFYEITLLDELGLWGDICKISKLPFKQSNLRILDALKKGEKIDLTKEDRQEMQKLLWFYIDFHLEKPLKSRRFLENSYKL